ncbi:hypothetical protein ACIRPT_40560 [Streptomyces sp. NPDC101227]|uniref:hypothetical protein n=1 Tax=Streptomyces sp. NPDC101227 TaxID=3366136 RepID=UPI00381205F2
MGESLLKVRLAFDGQDSADVAERDMEFLLEEIRGVAIERLVHPSAAAPSGTRADESLTYTSVVLGLASAPALRALILLAQDWLARRNSGTIDIKLGEDELHLTSVSRADQRKAIEAFIDRTTDPSVDA